MLLNKIKKTKNRFRAYPTRQAVQTTGSTASIILATIDDDLAEKAADAHGTSVLVFDHAVS